MLVGGKLVYLFFHPLLWWSFFITEFIVLFGLLFISHIFNPIYNAIYKVKFQGTYPKQNNIPNRHILTHISATPCI